MRSGATIRRVAAQTEGRAHERSEVAARSRAENRARQFFGKLCLVGKLPRSVLGICTARRAPPKAAARVLRKPTASPPPRWIVRKLGEAQERGRISAARAGQREILPSLGRVSHDGPRGRGGKSQPLVKEGEAEPNEPPPRWNGRELGVARNADEPARPAPRISPRRRRPEGRASGGA